MRNFFVSDRKVIPEHGPPDRGMVIAPWPWPCRLKKANTKNRVLGLFSFGSKMSVWGVRLWGVVSGMGLWCPDWGRSVRIGCRVRIRGRRLGGKCQDWGLLPRLGVADWG